MRQRWEGHEFETSAGYIASHFVKRWGVGCGAGEIAQMVKCFSHSIKTKVQFPEAAGKMGYGGTYL